MEWIKCSDRLPEVGEWVLCYIGNKKLGKNECEVMELITKIDPDFRARNGEGYGDIDYWMPLPESPKESSEMD